MGTSFARPLLRREEAASATIGSPDSRAVDLAEVVSAFRPMVFRIARRYVGPEDAEDVTQETLLRAVRHVRGVRSAGALGGWLRSIATHESLRRLRALSAAPATVEILDEDLEGRQANLERSAPDPQKIVFARIEAEEIRQAIRTLPEAQRTAVRMHYFDGITAVEIGKAMGISDGAVRKRLLDARRALLKLLKPAFAEGGMG